MKAWRSTARLSARRTRTSLNGGLVMFRSRLSALPAPTRVMTMPGTAALSWAAIWGLLSSGLAASARPACSAAVRVPRSFTMR